MPTVIDSLIVELGLDASDFISSKDRAREATAAIAAGVEDIDRAGDKAAKGQAARDREARTRANQEARDAAKRTKDQQRTQEQAERDVRRERQAEQKAKDKDRADEVRKEKEAERERTLANRTAAKERKESFDTAKEAALGFGAAVAGVLSVEFFKNAANGIAEVGREAHNLDLPTAEVAAFSNAVASMVGGSADAARATLGNLSGALVGLRTGTDMQTLPTLLGQLSRYSGQQLTLKGPDGKFLNSEGLLMQLAKAGEHMDPAIYSNLVGGLLDQGSINLTEKGPAAVQAAIDAAKVRGVPDDKQAQAAQALQTATVNLEQSFANLGNRLVFQFGPDLTRFLQDFQSLLQFMSGLGSKDGMTIDQLRAERQKHWHDSEVERLILRGASPADAEKMAAAADSEAAAQSATSPRGGAAPGSSSTAPGDDGGRHAAGVTDTPGVNPWGIVSDLGHPQADASGSHWPWIGGLVRKYIAGPAGRALGLPSAFNPSPNLPADIEAEVRKDALAQGADPDHMVALFRAEHGGYNGISPAGAIGPGQLMPGTAAMLGLPTSVSDPNYDWRDNVVGAIRYWVGLDKRFGGKSQVADAAYNAGPGGSSKAFRKLHPSGDVTGISQFYGSNDDSGLPDETQKYWRQIQTNIGRPGVTAPVAAGTSHNDNSTTSHVTVGKVEVHTGPNSDADAIAAGMHQAFKNHPLVTPQANSGLE